MDNALIAGSPVSLLILKLNSSLYSSGEKSTSGPVAGSWNSKMRGFIVIFFKRLMYELKYEHFGPLLRSCNSVLNKTLQSFIVSAPFTPLDNTFSLCAVVNGVTTKKSLTSGTNHYLNT